MHGFRAVTHIGKGDDFDKRHPRAVIVQEGIIREMELLAGVFFHMNAFDADPLGFSVFAFDIQIPIPSNRMELLGDLKSLRKIAVEIILTIETNQGINGHMQGIRHANRIDDGLLIH